MAALDPAKSRTMEYVAAMVIIGFTAMMAFITVAPYMGLTPTPNSDAAIIAQHQTTIQNVTLAIISFLFGASVGTQAAQSASATAANTQSKLVDALIPAPPAPVDPDVVVPVNPGDTVSVHANEVKQ